MNSERLLNVAKACRESPNAEKFNMGRIMHPCGTPACAFGHYAARSDLQSEFRLLNPREFRGSRYLLACDGVALVDDGREIGYDTGEARAHFDLTAVQNEVLFGPEGCGRARSAIEAAEYIERFVAADGVVDEIAATVEPYV